MKLHFHANDQADAQKAFKAFTNQYGQVSAEDAEMIVVLGGDGTMLSALHLYGALGKSVYGINYGTVGFLMNPAKDTDLIERLQKTVKVGINPLRMRAIDIDGNEHNAIAFNEVSLLRETRQAAKLKISVDDVVRISELVCDGILLSTPAGSTAYNLSANGPILPLAANVMALTPISAFRPRRWSGALLHCKAKVTIDVLEDKQRPVSVTADSKEFRNIVKVDIHQAEKIGCTLRFNPDHHLEERILSEQFAP